MASSNVSIRTANSDVYGYVFPFEENYRHERAFRYFQGLPFFLPFVIVAAYVSLVFLGRSWMKHRTRFQLRGVLFVWNSFLALATLLALVRYASQLAYTVRHFGLHHSVCGTLQMDMSQTAYLYQLVFILSKVIELADTAFVVLRKQPLSFLHWYHHSTVLLYCWYSYYEQAPTGRWFAFINACVHAVMYSYYALKSLSIRIPRPVAMVITVFQLSQMVVGCYINYYVYRCKQLGVPCDVTADNIRVSLLMYASYFVLFLWYFNKAYLAPSKGKVLEKSTKGKSE